MKAKHSFRGVLVACALSVALGGLPAATAQADAATAREAGLGAASALSTLIYGPAKLFYAGFGLLLSGAAWAWTGGDAAVAGPIFNAAVRGDYVITPEHLTMQRSVEFVGRMPEDRPPPVATGPYRYDEGF